MELYPGAATAKAKLLPQASQPLEQYINNTQPFTINGRSSGKVPFICFFDAGSFLLCNSKVHSQYTLQDTKPSSH